MSLLDSFPLRTGPATEPDEPGCDPSPVAPGSTPASEPEPETAAPLVLLEGDRMSEREQFAATLAHAIRTARRRAADLAEREGSLPHALAAGQPPSVRDQHRYAKDKHWVPPGNDGGVLEGMGVVYHWMVGRPGVAAGNALSAISARPFRWCAAALLTLGAVNVVLLIAHDHAAVILSDLAAGLLAAMWAAAGYLLMRVTRATIRDDETEDE